jgi:hypothetical protein
LKDKGDRTMRRPKVSPGLLLVAVFLTYSASLLGQEIYRDQYGSDGITRFFTKARDALLEQPVMVGGTHVSFSFHAVSPPPAPGWAFMLVVSVHATDGLLISEGDTLTLTPTNQNPITLRGQGSENARESSNGKVVSETAAYSLSSEDLKELGGAEVVGFTLIGQATTVRGNWPKVLLDDARAFAQRAPALVAQSNALEPVGVTGAISSPAIRCGATAAQIVRFGLHVRQLGSNRTVPANAEMPDLAVQIDNVDADSPAGRTGLSAGDVIARVNDQKISGLCDLIFALRSEPGGAAVTMEVVRDGKLNKFTATQ